jgi:lysophospholipase L1-like esterase
MISIGIPATVTEYGVSGQTFPDADAAFATQVTPYNPTVLVVELGVNDPTHSIALSATRAAIASIKTKALLLNPNMKFVFMSAMVDGELWATGPVYSGNPYDSGIDAVNVELAAAAEAIGANAIYVNTRAQLLKMIVVRGPAAPGVHGGVCTLDDVHPGDELCLAMRGLCLAQINLVSGSDRVHIVGDSITNLSGPNGGWHTKPTGFRDVLRGRSLYTPLTRVAA